MNSSRRVGLSSAMAILLLLTLNLGGPGQAQEPEAGSLEVINEVDAREYAEDYEVPQGEAVDRLSLQEDLAVFLGQISAVAGPRLAGSFLQHEPEFRGIVRLTGEEPLFGLDALSRDNTWSFVTIEYGFEHSERDFMRAIEVTPWEEISPSIQGVSFDPVIGEIVVDTVGGADDAARLELELAAQYQLQGLPVSVRAVEEMSSDSE